MLAVVPPLGMALALNASAASAIASAGDASAPRASPEPIAKRGPARYRRCVRGRRFLCCPPDSQPCIRSGAARLTLLSIGVLAGAAASGLLFALGDRYGGGGDPSTFLVGAGALAGAGALFGSLVGRLGGDRPGDPDRVRPATLGLDYRFGTPANLDETEPHALRMTFAPNYFFPAEGGRLRLFGHVGGLLWPEKQVDPRPQNAAARGGQDGTAPVVRRERQLQVGAGFDLAVAMPYPAARRSAFLGPAELRYRPEFQLRRDVIDPGTADERVVERTMLLPMTVGVRWILSQRQRFTIYFGPRFDYVAFSEPGSGRMHRGGAQIGPFYGEAWYDVDFPMTLRARRDGKPRRASVNSQLNLGYVHSRFDGRGFNFGPVIGFLGPVHVRWSTRVRPAGWKVALQAGAGVAVGNGFTGGIDFGVVLPDLGERTP